MAMKVVKSICQMCGTNYAACGIDVHVLDGKIIKIEGTKGHPVNDGWLCPKGLAAIQMEYSPKRILYPMKRTGERGQGKWQRISWDEAMDTIVNKFRNIIETDGARAIGWFKGQGPGWMAAKDYALRFMHLIGSPNFAAPSHVCEIARLLGHSFTYGMSSYPDYENANLILWWGYNPVNTGMPYFVRGIKAKERGAKLIVIDPRFSKTAAKADMYVQIRPGSDGALALGMLNVIIEEDLYDKDFVKKWAYGFDQLAELVKKYPAEKVEKITWIPSETIQDLARKYATIKPACLHEGNGIDQQPNVAQTTRAISILQAITGNLDVPGGNVINPEQHPIFAKIKDMGLRYETPEKTIEAYNNSVSTHPLMFRLTYPHIPELRDAILYDKPYPIKAIFIHGANLAVTGENTKKMRKALMKVPFSVAFDHTWTPTVEMADLALPACTFLERNMLNSFLYHRPTVDAAYYQLQQKVVEPPGENRDDFEVISDMTRRMGYEEGWPWKTVKEWVDYELEPIGVTYQELADSPEDTVKYKYTPRELYRKYGKLFSLPFFPHGKCAFYSEEFESNGYDPLPTYVEPGESPLSSPNLTKEYPLICMACLKPGLYVHSQYRDLPWLKEIMPEPWIEIHSQKAKEIGVKDGETVVVKSPRNSIQLKCKIFDSLDPRVVALTHGWWAPVTNFLTSSQYACPITGATSNRCFLVNVVKLS